MIFVFILKKIQWKHDNDDGSYPINLCTPSVFQFVFLLMIIKRWSLLCIGHANDQSVWFLTFLDFHVRKFKIPLTNLPAFSVSTLNFAKLNGRLFLKTNKQTKSRTKNVLWIGIKFASCKYKQKRCP